jgi:hypothetical protein
VAQTLGDSILSSVTSLSRLLGEVSFLIDVALRILEYFCYASIFDKVEQGVLNGDRVIQG